MLRRWFLALLLGGSLVSAMTIDEQIAALKEAPPQERYKLMNALKERIATMNEAERQAAIDALKAQMNSGTEHVPNRGAMQHPRQLQQSYRGLGGHRNSAAGEGGK